MYSALMLMLLLLMMLLVPLMQIHGDHSSAEATNGSGPRDDSHCRNLDRVGGDRYTEPALRRGTRVDLQQQPDAYRLLPELARRRGCF